MWHSQSQGQALSAQPHLVDALGSHTTLFTAAAITTTVTTSAFVSGQQRMSTVTQQLLDSGGVVLRVVSCIMWRGGMQHHMHLL